MLKRIAQAFSHRSVAPILAGLVVALSGALAVNLSARQMERQAYQARIAELSRDAERAEALSKAQLAACHAVSRPDQRLTEAVYAGAGDERRLLQRPEGIDACARMESADQAVLSNLR